MSVLTNKQGLPLPLVRAVARDNYQRRSDLSVTEMISPPQIVQLRRRHENQITEDVVDRIWALMGSAVHHVLERAEDMQAPEFQESRVVIEVEGWTIGGKPDLWHQPRTLDNIKQWWLASARASIWTPVYKGILDDYKFVGAYSMILSDKPEWTAQTNVYGYMYRHIGLPVDVLRIITIYRDWTAYKALRERNYPQSQVEVHLIPVWSDARCLEFITERVRLHQAAAKLPDEALPPCSPEERWIRDEKWAVYKINAKTGQRNKSAVSGGIHSSLESAQRFAAGLRDAKGNPVATEIEHRPGSPVRCERFCDVAPFCHQYQSEIAAQQDKAA